MLPQTIIYIKILFLITLSLNLIINLIGLSVPPQTSDTVTPSVYLDAHGVPLAGPLPSAIALQPPNQSNTPQRPDSGRHSRNQPPIADGLSQGHTAEQASPVTTEVVL